MHAGEEGLIVLIPLAIVLYLDYRNRRKAREREAEAVSRRAEPSTSDTSETDAAPE